MISLWEKSITDNRITNDSLKKNLKTEVLVVGGGLAGILCAYLLTKAGVPCVLTEAKQIGGGITGNTTGKVTVQHGLIYADLLNESLAQQYYEINAKALDEYRRLASFISCDFEEKTAYVYSSENRAKLEREAKAYQILGIPLVWQDEPPLPFKTLGALGIQNQAQFNVLKLLLTLSKDIEVYENTFVIDIKGNQAITRDATISADHIILATHFPMVNIPGLYFMKLFQQRSYVVALRNAPDLNGMYKDEKQNGYSFRNYKDWLLLGGGGHRTGKKGGGLQDIKLLAAQSYPSSQVDFAWAAQDCMTLDSVPYIGYHRRGVQNLYVATGFNKWGMAGAMSSAITLTELIVSGKSEYETLFSPSRTMLHPQFFMNVLHSTQGLLSFGRRCPHMGCALKWNSAEKTWDCPCHGSRFEASGELINNPSKHNKKIL